jgi:hypothetical protein
MIVSIQQAINCLALFITMCTSNYYNITQCLPVWSYFPQYFTDYTSFIMSEPYANEQKVLKNDRNL